MFSSGGGIESNRTPGSLSLTIKNSIIAGNSAMESNDGPDIIPDPGGVFIVEYSLIGDNAGTTLAESQSPDANGNLIGSSAGGGLIDPMLDALSDNGGPTFTHSVQAGSPVINSGDPNAVAGEGEIPPLDQRWLGFPRILAGRLDIGAVEYFNPDFEVLIPSRGLIVDTVEDSLDGDYSLDDLSLREAIFLANGTPGMQTITFSSLFSSPQTISLHSQLPRIVEDLTVTGPGRSLLSIDAGDGADNSFGTADGYRIFEIIDPDFFSNIDVTLSGMTLKGGDTISGAPGGAISSQENLTILNSTIIGNSTGSGQSGFLAGGGGNGGGIYIRRGDLTVVDSTISGNVTGAGGDFNVPSPYGSPGSGGAGGGIYSRYGTLVLTRTSVSNNSTGIGGRDIFSGGRVSGGDGGGIFHGGPGTITDSAFVGNRSDFGSGAGIRSQQQDEFELLTIVGSTISENTSRFSGAGIFAFDDLAISNSTITNNTATSSFARGGGISHFDTLTLTNTIVANNSAPNDTDIRTFSGGTVAGAYNLIGEAPNVVGIADGVDGNMIGTMSNPIDPLLGPLANNGGVTQTHALLSGSPAVDAGDPAILFSPMEFDQRGVGYARVSNVRIDIGAFEVQTSNQVSADFDDDGDIDGTDFLSWQRGFGTPAPNATRGDGDANDDTVVNGLDLDIWKDQYGQTGLPIVAASLKASVQAPVEGGIHPASLNAKLVDAALLLAVWDSKSSESSALVEEPIAIEAAFAATFSTDNSHLVTNATENHLTTSAPEAESESYDQPWIDDELLERIFG